MQAGHHLVGFGDSRFYDVTWEKMLDTRCNAGKRAQIGLWKSKAVTTTYK